MEYTFTSSPEYLKPMNHWSIEVKRGYKLRGNNSLVNTSSDDLDLESLNGIFFFFIPETTEAFPIISISSDGGQESRTKKNVFWISYGVYNDSTYGYGSRLNVRVSKYSSHNDNSDIEYLNFYHAFSHNEPEIDSTNLFSPKYNPQFNCWFCFIFQYKDGKPEGKLLNLTNNDVFSNISYSKFIDGSVGKTTVDLNDAKLYFHCAGVVGPCFLTTSKFIDNLSQEFFDNEYKSDSIEDILYLWNLNERDFGFVGKTRKDSSNGENHINNLSIVATPKHAEDKTGNYKSVEGVTPRDWGDIEDAFLVNAIRASTINLEGKSQVDSEVYFKPVDDRFKAFYVSQYKLMSFENVLDLVLEENNPWVWGLHAYPKALHTEDFKDLIEDEVQYNQLLNGEIQAYELPEYKNFYPQYELIGLSNKEIIRAGFKIELEGIFHTLKQIDNTILRFSFGFQGSKTKEIRYFVKVSKEQEIEFSYFNIESLRSGIIESIPISSSSQLGKLVIEFSRRGLIMTYTPEAVKERLINFSHVPDVPPRPEVPPTFPPPIPAYETFSIEGIATLLSGNSNLSISDFLSDTRMKKMVLTGKFALKSFNIEI